MKQGHVQEQEKAQETVDLRHLYEEDETAWLEQMAQLIREGHFDSLDYENLSEFLTDMAIRDRREVKSRLTVLVTHLLKWDYQPDKRSKSWSSSIRTQRYDLQDLLTSKTLKNHAEEILSDVYRRAVKIAAGETDLPKKTFPEDCPYTLDQLLKDDD